MDQFLEFVTKQDLTWGSIIFMMAMSFFVAIFHTVIMSGLFSLTFNNKLFFVLNPLLIGTCALVDVRLGLVAFAFIFLSVFVLAIIGMFVAGFRDKAETKKEIAAFYKRYQIPPNDKTKKIVSSTLLVILIFVGIFYIGFITILIFIGLILFDAIFLPTNKSRFLKYQAVLPVSKIRSIAMGLVEVEGKVKMITPLTSPVSGNQCVGFSYSIETITRDDDGDERYSTIFSETLCNRFVIEDETGSIEVNPKNIEFIWLDNFTRERNNSKRYSENILKEGDSVVLIGKASSDANNRPIIEYDSFRKLLAIAPATAVNSFNKNKPLRHSFIFFSCIYCICIALVLITPIEVDRDKIIIKKLNWEILKSTPEPEED